MKIFLAVDDENIKKHLKRAQTIEVVDEENNIHLVKNLLGKNSEEYLVLSALKEDVEVLQDVARKSKKLGIKVLAIINDVEDINTKRIVSALAAENVNALLDVKDFSIDKVIELLDYYPEEFDYKILAEAEEKIVMSEPITEYVEKIKIVRSQVITCYSTDDSFDCAEMAVMLAHKINQNNNLSIVLIDMNNLFPSIDFFLNIDKNILQKFNQDMPKIPSLKAMVNSINSNMGLTDRIFNNMVIKDKKLKFDVITGLYDLLKDDSVSKEHYEQVIEMATKVYDVVIINTNPYLKSAATFTALMKATQIVAITKGNLAAIRNMLVTFDILSKERDKESIKIVVSGLHEESLNKDQLDRSITDNGYKIIGQLRLDPLRERTLNEGQLYSSIGCTENAKEYNEITKNIGFNVIAPERKKTLWKIGGK